MDYEKKCYERCWFCLANPAVQKHLLINIGHHCYVSLAKGYLVPEHILIIPIKHVPSSHHLSDAAVKELDLFKTAFVNYFDDKGHDVIFFETSFNCPHALIQVVPVPKIGESAIKTVVFKYADRYNLEIDEIGFFMEIKQIIPRNKSYFYMEIVNEKKCVSKLLHIKRDGTKFPVWFGRMVLADSQVLNVADRINWKHCKETEEEEIQVVEMLRKEFQSYEFIK